MFFLWLSIVVTISAIAGEACSTIRLDQPASGESFAPMANSPITDQVTGQNCNAHAASHLLNAFLQSQNATARAAAISPHSVYLTGMLNPRELDSAHGNLCKAADMVKQTGGCPREKTEEILNAIYRRSSSEDPDAIDLGSMAENLGQNPRNPRARGYQPEVQSDWQQFFCTHREGNPAFEVFRWANGATRIVEPRLPQLFLLKKLREQCEANWIQIPENLPRCSQTTYQSIPNNPRQVRMPSKEEFQRKLGELLEHRKPAGISYCRSIYSKANYSGIHSRTFPANILNTENYDWKRNFQEDCHFHASAVIGREKDPSTGKCLYRIRNSEGATGGPNLAPGLRRDNGDFLVPEETLLANIYRISHF